MKTVTPFCIEVWYNLSIAMYVERSDPTTGAVRHKQPQPGS